MYFELYKYFNDINCKKFREAYITLPQSLLKQYCEPLYFRKHIISQIPTLLPQTMQIIYRYE